VKGKLFVRGQPVEIREDGSVSANLEGELGQIVTSRGVVTGRIIDRNAPTPPGCTQRLEAHSAGNGEVELRAPAGSRPSSGPPRCHDEAYLQGWERIFGQPVGEA
jgi:hypothetical protein